MVKRGPCLRRESDKEVVDEVLTRPSPLEHQHVIRVQSTWSCAYIDSGVTDYLKPLLCACKTLNIVKPFLAYEIEAMNITR
jgi:hypothetical protein